MDQAALVGGKIQNEIAVHPHRMIPVVDQPAPRLYRVVFRLMIEPSRAKRSIDFGRNPQVAAFVAGLELVIDVTDAGKENSPFHRGPICFSSISALIADPADIGSAVTEHTRVGLKRSDNAPCILPVVVGRIIDSPGLAHSAVISITPIRAVEPYFKNLTVRGEQFAQLIAIVIEICRGP